MMVVTLPMKSSIACLCAFIALTAFSCSKSKPTGPPSSEVAPASFKVNLDTTRGPVIVEVTRASAPIGVDRFYNLIKAKFLDGARFFRVVPGFVVQFGMATNPEDYATWDFPLQDDPVLVSNHRGTLTFATSGPNTRTTQLFINLGNNERLDAQHFSAFGKVVSGMDFVDQIYSGDGQNPQQDLITAQGNAYLNKQFPHLDYITTARIVE
jgi:peptidyl-prolyl cis-trans isomerase A (cyclophilin A)